MKHVSLLWLALLLSCSALAQTNDTTAAGRAANPGPGTPPAGYVPEQTSWSHAVDSMLQYVNKAQIPSGILYDRVLPLAALPYFDRFRADTTSAAHLRQAYLELFIAAYNQTAFSLTPSQLRERAEALVRRDSVPLAVLDYRLHYLDTMAMYHNQLVLQNGLYHDVAGRTASPYTERLLTLAAPLTASVKQRAQFYIDPALLLGNRGRTVSSLIVDFGNGGAAITCLPGQVITVSYPTPGAKVLRFTVNFSNGTQAQSRARLTVVRQVARRGIILRLPDFEARDPFQDYYSSRNLHGKGEALVVLHHPTSKQEATASLPYKLRNPVVIMDGFDHNDESPLEGDFNENKSMYTLLVETGILGGLEALQRDLVILNFPKSPRRQVGGGDTADDVDGGTDFVERNAYVLETLLNTLKLKLALDPSTTAPFKPYKFTIIGPSMGGLISRYALAHMEQQQQLLADAGQPADPWWDHNTAEWISLDVPHTGANIPLADQQFLDFYKGTSESVRANLEQRLNSTAAKQFLVAHYTFTNGVGGAPFYRDRFMQALHTNGERNSMGYPVHLRRVALANGKLNGALPPSTEGVPGAPAIMMNIGLTQK